MFVSQSELAEQESKLRAETELEKSLTIKQMLSDFQKEMEKKMKESDQKMKAMEKKIKNEVTK